MTKRRMAFILAAMLTFTCAFEGKALAASVEPENEAVAVEAQQEESVSEEVTEEVDVQEPVETDDGTEVITEDTTEISAEEEPEAITEETEEAGDASEAAVTAEEAEEEETVETEDAAPVEEEEETEETGTTKDAKAMWHGFEYDANGNVLHYWESGKKVTERLVKDASTGKKYYFNKYGNPLINKQPDSRRNGQRLCKGQRKHLLFC